MSRDDRGFDKAYKIIHMIIDSLTDVVSGEDENVKLLVATVAAGGHVLIEGPPGTGKTLLAHGLASVIGGVFKRVQGNPDLLPTDLTGYHRYSLTGESVFVKGPVFTNILMFDELNRTPPRSQSALLQAMAEYSVSVDGVVYSIEKPFHVIATEVPLTQEVGIYPLTITLRDRFWIKIQSRYVDPVDEYSIVKRADTLYDFERIKFKHHISLEEFKWLQSFIDHGVYVDDRIIHYIVDIVQRLRRDERVVLGPSHRGSIFLYRVAKTIALINGRDYVTPDDVKYLAPYVLAHRIVLSRELSGEEAYKIVADIVERTPVPKE